MRPRPTFLLVLALGLAACGASTRGASPRGTLRALHSAIRRNDLAAVYAMLPDRARQQESLAQFRARMSADSRELTQLARSIEETLDQRAPAADVPLARGGSATTVEDPEGWRLSHPGFGPVRPATPEDAVRAFHAALVRQNLPGLLAILSARARGSLQAEIASLIDALADPSGLQSTGPTQRREVRLPDGRTIVLLFENGSWRVDEIQ